MVDDEADVREVAAELLRRLGFEVRTACDGREGLEAFQAAADRIAVVLLDVAMPEMGGEETVRALRCIRPDVPLVLMSGFRQEFAAPHLEAGPRAGFVQRPFTPEQLASALRTVLEGEA